MFRELANEFAEHGIIPVVTIEQPDKALPLADALVKGGLPVAEITCRTPCATDAIARIHKEYPDMLLAAGTVLTLRQAEEAITAGARCIISPGMVRDVARYCSIQQIPYIPGISTPSEICQALELGLRYLKFFPASPMAALTPSWLFSVYSRKYT